MGKVSKILYMIDLLNTGNKYSILELSDRLNVSERMIRYYKEELEKNGIYIESFKGPNGGYFLLENLKYYINFNKYDIELLEYSYKKLIENDFEFKDKYLELIEKVKNMSSIEEEKNKFIDNIKLEDAPEIYNFINDIISKKDKINISYLDVSGKIINRTIHPLQLFKFKNSTYVTAYCELRRDIRHFELDRIKITSPNKKD